MAAEIKKAVNVEATLVRSGGGIFDVEVDGKMLFSKGEHGRFPEPGELVKLMKTS